MRRHGQISLELIIVSAVTVTIISGFVVWSASLLNFSSRDYNRSLAFSIAEAGIEYYRWHLAHAPADYYDGNGTSTPGPYVHQYYDKDGNTLGTFTLTITPPPLGSRVVRVRSVGEVNGISSLQKIIEVRLGIPSLAKFAFAINSNVRFGAGTEVFGPIHSNGGIRFDGLAHNLVTSAQASYDDPDSDDCNNNVSFGVHTCVNPNDPSPPAAVPNRPDVFLLGRQFPLPALDFTGMTQNLSQIKSDAQASGFYATSSGAFGYDLVLKTDDTFDVYKVTALVANPGGTCATNGTATGQSGWGTWSISAETLVNSNVPFPANGLLFFEDHLWVRGQIDKARLTIASGKFPDNASTRTSITVNSDVRYTSTNGDDVIGLVAQNNINVGLVSSDTIRIDAALIAQNGRTGRYYYNTACKVGGVNYYTRSF
jgi:hypothetical protein